MKTRRKKQQRRIKGSTLIATTFAALMCVQGCGEKKEIVNRSEIEVSEIPGGKHCLSEFEELVPKGQVCRETNDIAGQSCNVDSVFLGDDSFDVIRFGDIIIGLPYACVSKDKQQITIKVCDDDKVKDLKNCSKMDSRVFIYDLDKKTVSGQDLNTKDDVVYDLVKEEGCTKKISFRKNRETGECEQLNCLIDDFPGEGWDAVDSCEEPFFGICNTNVKYRKNTKTEKCQIVSCFTDDDDDFPGDGWEEVDSCDDEAFEICTLSISYRKNTETGKCETVTCRSASFPGKGWEEVDSCDAKPDPICMPAIRHRKNTKTGKCEQVTCISSEFPGAGWEEVDSCDHKPAPKAVRAANLKKVSLNDAASLFVADRKHVAESIQSDDAASVTPGKGLFKVLSDGAISEVELETADGVLDSPIAPDLVIEGDGYVLMGYGEVIIRGDDAADNESERETVLVRQSDGATFFVGAGDAFFPGVNPEIYNYISEGVAGELINVSVTPSGSIVYRSAVGNLIEIRIDEAEHANASIVNPEDHKVTYFTAQLDGAILYDADKDGSDDTYAAVLEDDQSRSIQSIENLYGYFATKKSVYHIADGSVSVDETGFELIENHDAESHSIHHTILHLSWDKDAKKLAYIPYAQTTDTGDGYFANSERSGQFFLDGNLFLVEKHGGIVDFEPANNQPRVVHDSAVHTLLRGESHFFIHDYMERVVRLAANGSTEVTAGLDNIEITRFERDPVGNLIVTGIDRSNEDDPKSVTAQINQAENTATIIDEKPFQIDVKDVVRLN